MSQITLNEYVFNPKEKIGRGSSGVVYLGYHNKTRDKVAIKRVDISNLNQKMGKLWNEIAIMKGLSHPSVIKLFDVHLDIKNEYLYLVMEYCDGSDLSDFIHDYILDLKQIHVYMSQIKDGLYYLHRKGIVHRDLKPHNMLIHKGKIKIADFGLSVMGNQSNNLMQTMCGSPLYMSPEIIEHQKYTAKSDLWSIGIIMYQLIYREHPYQNCKNFAELTLKVKNEEIKFPTRPPLDGLTLDLLQGLLTKNPHDRITWEDFFNHVWFRHPPAQTIKKFHSLEMSYSEIFNAGLESSNESEDDAIISISPEVKLELSTYDLKRELEMSNRTVSASMNIPRASSRANEDDRLAELRDSLSASRAKYGWKSEQVPNKEEGKLNLSEFVVKNYQKPPSRIPETMSRINPVRHNRPVYGTSAPTGNADISFSPSKLDFNSMGSGLLKYMGKSIDWVRASIDT